MLLLKGTYVGLKVGPVLGSTVKSGSAAPPPESLDCTIMSFAASAAAE